MIFVCFCLSCFYVLVSILVINESCVLVLVVSWLISGKKVGVGIRVLVISVR